MKSLKVTRCLVEVSPLPENLRTPTNKVVGHLATFNAQCEMNRPVSIVRARGGRLRLNAAVGLLRVRSGVPLELVSGDWVKKISKAGRQAGDGIDLILAPQSNVGADEIEARSILIAESARLNLRGKNSNLEVRGPGTLRVMESIEDLRLVEPAARMELDPYAALTDVSGSIVIRRAAHASISGPDRRSGKEFLRIKELPDDPDDIHGVTLNNIMVDVSLTGIRILNQLRDSARQAIPQIHEGLPGLNLRATSISTGPEKVSPLEYQYASAISTMTQSSTSPAAVRTLLAWCAYRTRQAVTPGRIEKGVLRAYRLIGYGERPMPAFLLYAGVALVMTIVGLYTLPFDITLSGIGKFLRVYADWLISPLHVLSLTKSESDTRGFVEPWDTLARLAVAIPFATAIISLRKYVKQNQG